MINRILMALLYRQNMFMVKHLCWEYNKGLELAVAWHKMSSDWKKADKSHFKDSFCTEICAGQILRHDIFFNKRLCG